MNHVLCGSAGWLVFEMMSGTGKVRNGPLYNLTKKTTYRILVM